MRVLFLTQTGPNGASARYRVFQYLPYLEAHGAACTVVPAVGDALVGKYMQRGGAAKAAYYGKIIAQRLKDLLTVRRYDVVFLQRDFLVHSFPVIELAMSRLQSRLVFDLDDATFLLPSGKRPGVLLRLLNDQRKIERIGRRCAHFVAGNAVLASYARAFAPKVTVIPTSIDVERYNPHRPTARDGAHPVVGWIGSPGTLLYLREILPALCRIHERGVRFVLRVVGADLNEEFPFPVECRPWNVSTEAEEVAAFDVGVMPLIDDDWSRAKSGTKLLQYLAAEVAAVASPVGVNAEILQDGGCGLPARTLADWENQLTAVLVDPSLRASLGKRGRARVIEEYSTAVSAPKLLSVLRNVAQAG